MATLLTHLPDEKTPPDPILPEAFLGMWEILKRRPFWMIISSYATDCIYHSVLIVHLVPIAIEAGVSHIQAASLVGVMGLGTIIGRISLGILADRIGVKLGGVHQTDDANAPGPPDLVDRFPVG